MKKRSKVLGWRPWTATDEAELVQYSSRKSPVDIVARLMRRSEMAIRQKARVLGIRELRENEPGCFAFTAPGTVAPRNFWGWGPGSLRFFIATGGSVRGPSPELHPCDARGPP